MNENGISFSKEKLATALQNFDEIKDSSVNFITKIEEELEIIETNWKGPEHDEASSDKDNAIQNLKKAKDMLNSMSLSITQLNTNAKNVSYNN